MYDAAISAWTPSLLPASNLTTAAQPFAAPRGGAPGAVALALVGRVVAAGDEAGRSELEQ